MNESDALRAEDKIGRWEAVQTFGGVLVVIGVLLEVGSHLVASPIQTLLSNYRKFEIARLNLEAAELRVKASQLDFQIEDSKKKIAPRNLTQEAANILATLRGKIQIAYAFENNPESENFASSILSAIGGNGARASWIRLKQGSKFGSAQGLVLFIPSKPTSTVEAEKDIVYATFMNAGLHIGVTNAPAFIASENPEIAGIPLESYILFIGLKPLY